MMRGVHLRMKKLLYTLPLMYVLASPVSAQNLTPEQLQRCQQESQYFSESFERLVEDLSQLGQGLLESFSRELGGKFIPVPRSAESSATYLDVNGKLDDIANCVILNVNKKGNGDYGMEKTGERKYTIKTLNGLGLGI